MKKTATIAAIVLGLMLAASTAARQDHKGATTKKNSKRFDSDTCVAAVCGIKGGSCNVDDTICPVGTMCIDGSCTTQTVGSSCDDYGDCYASEEDLTCDSDTDECVKRKGAGEA